MLNITPIKLLQGSHTSTARTGSGCFMNAISYLNGDTKITDRPTCVDPVVRTLMVNINDGLGDADRQRLLPFVHRAMATAGSGQDVTEDRLALAGRCVSLMLRAMDNRLAEQLECRVNVSLFQARTAVNHRRLDEAAAAVGDALMAVLMANRYTSYSADVVNVLFKHVDAILPQADEPSVEVKQRAEALVAVHNKHLAHAIG